MKMDYDLIKSILEDIEKRYHGQDTLYVHAENLPEKRADWERRHINYHIKLLSDDGLIQVLAWPPHNSLDIPIGRMTAEGHRVLEAMQNNTIFNKLKNGALGMGKETLKQVPAMFIKLALAGATS